MPVRTLPLLLLLGLLGAADSGADDHARARAWVEQGRVLPLATVVDRLPRELAGTLLEAELEEEHGRPVYELELLLPDGRVLEVEVDARDGKVLDTEEERD